MPAIDAQNIVAIISDTFRRDNLENRSRRPVRTPSLDRFADERAHEQLPIVPHHTDFASEWSIATPHGTAPQ